MVDNFSKLMPDTKPLETPENSQAIMKAKHWDVYNQNTENWRESLKARGGKSLITERNVKFSKILSNLLEIKYRALNPLDKLQFETFHQAWRILWIHIAIIFSNV